MSKLQSINPYNGEINAEFETLSDEQITAKIEIAQNAYLDWKETSWAHRKEMFHKLADVMEADVEKYAKLQTLEM
jgi:succinate-semialdehyde dehydrogenase / glutarate-semialdehyde dehydrogenase